MQSVLFSAFICLCTTSVFAAPLVGPYKIKDVTVSGISSGGYMAVQGPFYCAEGSAIYAQNRCMKTTMGTPNSAALAALTVTDENLLVIDRTSHLKDDKIYLFAGSADSVVEHVVAEALDAYYQYFIPRENIATEYSVPAEHSMPTLEYGNECSQLASPYMNKCAFDAAGAAFKQLYGADLQAPVPAVAGHLLPFSQGEYVPVLGGSLSSLAETGYIYVPAACQQGAECRLHVSFHGCGQTEAQAGPVYAQRSGYNEWAEANSIVVLYPYAQVSEVAPLNPNGCWDWWGYTGPYYGVQAGVQVQFVRNLIRAVSGL